MFKKLFKRKSKSISQSSHKENSYWELFPDKGISTQTIHGLFIYPVNKHEKFISVCMALTIAAVYNPLFIGGYIFVNGNWLNLIFLILMFVLLIYSFIKKSFSFIGMGAVSAAKIYPFTEAVSDTLVATALMLLIYLINTKTTNA